MMAEQIVDPFKHKFPNNWTNKDGTLTLDAVNYLEYKDRWYHDMWQRSGGISGDKIDQSFQLGNEDIFGTQSGDVEDVATQFNDLDMLAPPPELIWNKRIISRFESAIAGDRDMFLMRVGATALLPEFPDVNSEFIGINFEGRSITVDGNGNLIKIRDRTDRRVNWCANGKSIHFHWFEAQSSTEKSIWVAI